MAKTKQMWGDVRTAPRDFLHQAFQQEREGILKQIIRLKIDVDSVNQNRFVDDPIEICLDYQQDLLEFAALPREMKVKVSHKV